MSSTMSWPRYGGLLAPASSTRHGLPPTVAVVEARDVETALDQRRAQRLGPPHHLVVQAAEQQQRMSAEDTERLDLYAVVEGLRWPTLIGAYTPDQAVAVLDDHLSTLFG